MAKAMLAPVRCNHCRTVYDLGNVETVARYADCTVYKTPCCGRTVDDRERDGMFGTATPAFTRVDPEQSLRDQLRADMARYGYDLRRLADG